MKSQRAILSSTLALSAFVAAPDVSARTTTLVSMEPLAELSLPAAETVAVTGDYIVASAGDHLRVARIAGENGLMLTPPGPSAQLSPTPLPPAPLPPAQLRPEQFGLPAQGEFTHVTSSIAHPGYVIAVWSPAHPLKAGWLLLIDVHAGALVEKINVGYDPDSAAWSSHGSFAVVVNEGEPGYTAQGLYADPPGSISIVDVTIGPRGFASMLQLRKTLPVEAEHAAGMRTPPGLSAPMIQASVEPEYVTISGETAYVTLQESSGVLVVDCAQGAITNAAPLGPVQVKIDANDKDRDIQLIEAHAWPMPDQVAAFTQDGQQYLVFAEEGDSRGDASVHPSTGDTLRLKQLRDLGRVHESVSTGLDRLEVCVFSGDANGDRQIESPHALGTRSVSVVNAQTLERISSTGSQFERAISALHPALYNTNSPGETDTRSDNRGPEPEGIIAFTLHGRPYAMATLERPGLLAVVDVSAPEYPQLVHLHPAARDGHMAPEGMALVEQQEGSAVVAVCYEKSGHVVLYEIKATKNLFPEEEP